MTTYIGIDLGTTNSAICSYDGKSVRIWKSPEQNDITPSVIYIDKRGNRFYGSKAYHLASFDPVNSASLFKRFLGTTTKIELLDSNISLTPEECSAEILKILFGYLPEELRNSKDIATVITVPAAFNQVKKDATLQAASLAGIGKVALMQEPVAAIMSVMNTSKQEGIFLLYDLGGGTFDVSLAENIHGKVNLLAHGGIEMCGGRDLDRSIFTQIVVPWMREKFSLPPDFLTNPQYNALCRIAQWASERAKIELSFREESIIALTENETGTRDLSGTELYVDIPVDRSQYNSILYPLISETIAAAKETMSKAGIPLKDIQQIVFIGGPTNYKPLRDRVASELGLTTYFDINPMTAVAEGASIFAESIDWSSKNHNRKTTNAEINTGAHVSFKYTSRTSNPKAKVLCVPEDANNEFTIEVISLDTGWCSGRAALKDKYLFELPLQNDGDNLFKITVYNSLGQELKLDTHQITITRTMATIGAIPASHSVGLEMLDKYGGCPILEFIIQEGDELPKKGKVTVKAGQTIRSDSTAAINIKLWEGSILHPISDNRFIGVLKIYGTDFEGAVIPIGADIDCEYEMSDSGTIKFEVSVPCIGASFGNRNFYSRQEGMTDLLNIDKLVDESRKLINRIDSITEKVPDVRLINARIRAVKITELESTPHDLEDVQMAFQELLEVKKILNVSRLENLKAIRQLDLERCLSFFDTVVRSYAKQTEENLYDNLARAMRRSVERNDAVFDAQLSELKYRNYRILFRQDWFVIDCFNRSIRKPFNFSDKSKFEYLKAQGLQKIRNDQINELRAIVENLNIIEIVEDNGEDMSETANIVKG